MANIDKLYERRISSVEQNARLSTAGVDISVNIKGITNVLTALLKLPANWNRLGTFTNNNVPGPALQGLNTDEIITVLNGLAAEANQPKIKSFFGFTNTTKGYLAKAEAVVKMLKKTKGNAKLQELYLSNLASVLVAMRGSQDIINHFTSCLATDKQLFETEYKSSLLDYANALIANKGVPFTSEPVPQLDNNKQEPAEDSVTDSDISDAVSKVNASAENSLIQRGIDWLKAFFSKRGAVDKRLAKQITAKLLDGKMVEDPSDKVSKKVPMLVKYMRVHPDDKTGDNNTIYTNYQSRFERWWKNNSSKYIESNNRCLNMLFNEKAVYGDRFKQLIMDIIKLFPDVNSDTAYTAINAAFKVIQKDNGVKYFRNIDYSQLA